jgi:hypothetical protein
VATVALGSTLSVACASAPESKPAEQERLIDDQSDARILFEAAKDVFAARGIDSALMVDEAMVLASPWQQVNKELRHRIMVRVIEMGGGRRVALNVTSEYLRRTLDAGEEMWVPASDELTRQRKKRDELDMGAAIKERYDARKE